MSTPAQIENAILALQEEVYNINVANGWYESDRSFGDDIALLHSEASEMFEAYRDNGLEDATKPRPADHPAGLPKPEGVGSEAADVLIRLLDTCKRYNIDLYAETIRKIEYNKTRGHRHGGKLL